jgi:RNA polymerase sigma-70 factor (ECF subfamily)
MAEQFTPHAIRDDQLRMMVSCCDPRLAEEAQVSLVLHLVCGFSVDEIAGAFLSGHDAVEKRISRSKKRLAEWGRLFDLGAGDFPTRLWAVQRAIYLLFNEGYHGASTQNPVRSELCHEAMRLTEILLDHPFGRTPASYALLSLLCFNAARLPGRMNAAGDLTPLAEQDRSLWDRSLICRGVAMLERSAAGSELTEYHVEAMIASVHAAAASIESTDWSAILEYYDSLRRLRPSPVVELNRAIVIAQIDGAERALSEICRIADRDRLDRYPFYWATLGELESRLGRHAAARDHFVAAGALARNPAERRFLNGRALTEGQV